MTQGRTRRLQDRLVKARAFTRALARYESTMKPADAYKRLQTWQNIELIKARELQNLDDVVNLDIPKREYFYTWWKQDLEIASAENFQEWLKPYSPADMHNNPFWSSPLSPYPLVDSNKELLLNAYNIISRYWFLPLGIKRPVISVSQAVWLCIVVNTQTRLKDNLIDAWLLAEYFSAIHINNMHDRDNPAVTPTTPPMSAIDDNALFYLESSPWNSTLEYLNWVDMVDKSFYKIPPYIFNLQQNFMAPQESISNYVAWQLQYPMLYGSQIRNMPWNPPYLKALRMVAGTCIEFLNYFKDKDMIEDVATTTAMLKKCNQILGYIDNRRPKNIKKTTIGEEQIGAGNDEFDLTLIDRYYRLMLNLSQLLVNDMHMPLESHELLGSPIVKEYLKKSALQLPKSP